MATRFRLTSDDTDPAVLPTEQTYTHFHAGTPRYRKLLTTDSSALATVTHNPDTADHHIAGDAKISSYVSASMSAGIVFTSGETIKFAIQGFEQNAGNNQAIQIWVGIWDSAGTTLRRALRSKISEGTELPLTTATNRFLSTTQDGATYTTVADDLLVVEIGHVGTPTAAGGINGHNAVLRFGSAGAGGDLPENDTEAGTTFNPWIEFVPDIFGGAPASFLLRNPNQSTLLRM